MSNLDRDQHSNISSSDDSSSDSVLVSFNYTNGDADLVDHLPQVELKPGESVELTVSPRKAGHVDIVAFTSQESNVR